MLIYGIKNASDSLFNKNNILCTYVQTLSLIFIHDMYAFQMGPTEICQTDRNLIPYQFSLHDI